ncbi:MAG: nucleotidyltransferase domain-containing protein [Cyanobacteria bacterium J06634_6]
MITEVDQDLRDRIGLSSDRISQFCEKWNISKLEIFGSVLRSDFTPESDIDVLVSFLPGARQGLLTRIKIMHELEDLTARRVDVIARKSVEDSDNWIRRQEILTTVKTIYE